jgi:signal transduction histidine kinase
MDELSRGGVITLVSGVSRNGHECVEFGVIDDGPGIPDEVKDRVCELFYSRKTDGTGIGLASVAKAAQLHGGCVIIADVDPTGADVRIQIPIA